MTIRLLAVDEHPLVRIGLTRVCLEAGDILTVGAAGTSAEAVRSAVANRPTVAVVGLRLPDGDGLSTAVRLRELRADLGVVLLGETDDQALTLGALRAGLSGYVAKSAPSSVLVAAIRTADAQPSRFSSPRLGAALRANQPRLAQLSAREREVLQMLADGTSIAIIATRLRLSDSTVKTYVSRIYGKLHVSNRSQALVAALQQGLLAA
jgi:DNA-binding NarL/FixJ family response regulator